MIIGIILVILLLTLSNRFENPWMPTVIYVAAKAVLNTGFLALASDYPWSQIIGGLVISVIISVPLAFVISWLTINKRNESWPIFVSMLIAIPLILI